MKQTFSTVGTSVSLFCGETFPNYPFRKTKKQIILTNFTLAM